MILIENVLKEKTLAALAGVSVLLLLSSFIVISRNVADLPSSIIIHFDSINGVDRFGEKTDLWNIWFMVALFSIINFFLGFRLFFRERIFTYILFGTNAFLAFLLLVIAATIVAVN